jgi:hypothetical protein
MEIKKDCDFEDYKFHENCQNIIPLTGFFVLKKRTAFSQALQIAK